MPRIRAYEENYAGSEFLVAIERAFLVPGERMTQARMAEASGIPKTTIRTRCADPMTFTVKELRKMVKAGLPAEAILAVCGCKMPKKQAAGADELAELLKQALTKIVEGSQ